MLSRRDFDPEQISQDDKITEQIEVSTEIEVEITDSEPITPQGQSVSIAEIGYTIPEMQDPSSDDDYSDAENERPSTSKKAPIVIEEKKPIKPPVVSGTTVSTLQREAEKMNEEIYKQQIKKAIELIQTLVNEKNFETQQNNFTKWNLTVERMMEDEEQKLEQFRENQILKIMENSLYKLNYYSQENKQYFEDAIDNTLRICEQYNKVDNVSDLFSSEYKKMLEIIKNQQITFSKKMHTGVLLKSIFSTEKTICKNFEEFEFPDSQNISFYIIQGELHWQHYMGLINQFYQISTATDFETQKNGGILTTSVCLDFNEVSKDILVNLEIVYINEYDPYELIEKSLSSYINFIVSSADDYQFAKQVRNNIEHAILKASEDILNETLSGYSLYNHQLQQNFFMMYPGVLTQSINLDDPQDQFLLLDGFEGNELGCKEISGTFYGEWTPAVVSAIDSEILELLYTRCKVYCDNNVRSDLLHKPVFNLGSCFVIGREDLLEGIKYILQSIMYEKASEIDFYAKNSPLGNCYIVAAIVDRVVDYIRFTYKSVLNSQAITNNNIKTTEQMELEIKAFNNVEGSETFLSDLKNELLQSVLEINLLEISENASFLNSNLQEYIYNISYSPDSNFVLSDYEFNSISDSIDELLVKFECSKNRGVVGDYCELYVTIFDQIQKIVEIQLETENNSVEKLWYGVNEGWCDKIIEDCIKEQRWKGIVSEARIKIVEIETKRDANISFNIDWTLKPFKTEESSPQIKNELTNKDKSLYNKTHQKNENKEDFKMTQELMKKIEYESDPYDIRNQIPSKSKYPQGKNQDVQEESDAKKYLFDSVWLLGKRSHPERQTWETKHSTNNKEEEALTSIDDDFMDMSQFMQNEVESKFIKMYAL